jgi:hypothetical protein
MRPATLDGYWDQSFRASPYWLRFELGGEVLGNVEQPVPRFIQAFHRAQTVANALFATSISVTAIVGASPKSGRFAPAFKALDVLGFRAPAPWCEWSAPFIPGDDEGVPLNWRAIELSDPMMRDTLLWTSIAYEMRISPKASVESWLVDFEAGVTLHVYDDRGMDVRALDREAIEPFYRQFDAWLLDYDRARMTAAFE